METYTVASIVCPQCGTELQPVDEVCHACGASTAGDGETAGKKPRKRLIDRPWLVIVVLLHVGFLGIPLYWKTSYSTPVRLAIILASIVYTILAVGGIIWGCLAIFNSISPML